MNSDNPVIDQIVEETSKNNQKLILSICASIIHSKGSDLQTSVETAKLIMNKINENF